MKEYFKGNYADQVKVAFEPLFQDNLDAAVIDAGYDPIRSYKLVILSSAYLNAHSQSLLEPICFPDRSFT